MALSGPASTRPSPGRRPSRIVGAMTNTITPTLPLVAGQLAARRRPLRVGFAIRHLGVAKVRGLFSDVRRRARRRRHDRRQRRSRRPSTLASIDTANADRDAHVRSADLLDVEQRPTMRVRVDRDHRRRIGLDARSATSRSARSPGRSTFAVEFGGVADFVDGTRHAGFEATGELRRKDFGLGFGPLGAMLGDVVKIDLDLEFIEPR